MAQNVLTADVIAKAALMVLDNNLIGANLVYRGYEDEFDRNGYKIGDTVMVRRPAQFTVRRGETAQIQEVKEGKFPITVNILDGVDFKFSSTDLTLRIEDLAERVMKPALLQLSNNIDMEVWKLYKSVPSWAGTPGQTINSFADFGKGPGAARQDGGAAGRARRRHVGDATTGACSARRPRCSCRTRRATPIAAPSSA